MSLEGDCQEVEVSPNLELLISFGMSLEEGMKNLWVWSEVDLWLKICSLNFKFVYNKKNLWPFVKNGHKHMHDGTAGHFEKYLCGLSWNKLHFTTLLSKKNIYRLPWHLGVGGVW
jgi:hypothetical protein